MMIAVSACLIGENCKYNGGSNYSEKVAAFLKGHEIIAVCPEVMGGLSTPREPAEIVGGVVRTRGGVCVDDAFRKGAAAALALLQEKQADLVILQPRSPSCGVRQIYDGTFSGRTIDGAGVFASLLRENGFRVVDAEDL